jgi:hypothetical protein
MDTSERFLRFAAECELMAKVTRDRENKTVWRSIAQRWIRCAELVERQNSLAQDARSMKHRGKPALRFIRILVQQHLNRITGTVRCGTLMDLAG